MTGPGPLHPPSGIPCPRSTFRMVRTESLARAKDSAGVCSRQMILNRRTGTGGVL